MKLSRGSLARRNEVENKRMRDMIFFKKVSLDFNRVIRDTHLKVYSKEVNSYLLNFRELKTPLKFKV